MITMKDLKYQSVQLITSIEDENNLKLCYQKEPETGDNENRIINLQELIKIANHSHLNGFNFNICKLTTLDLSHINENLNEIHSLNIPRLKKFIARNSCLSLVPPFIYNSLPTLEHLDLSQNKIVIFNCNFKSQRCIKVIKLANNRFENFPRWFLMYKCPSLVDVDFSFNSIKVCKHVKESYDLQVMNLEKIELVNCGLSDKHLPYLKEFRSLKELNISNNPSEYHSNGNKFDNLDTAFIDTNWVNIECLYLKYLSLLSFPKSCLNLTTLKTLDLSYNTLWSLPENISKLCCLECLIIDHCEIYSLPESLCKLKSLKILKAPCNFIEVIKSVPSTLQYIDLYDNRIDTINCDISTINCDFGLNFIDYNNSISYIEGRSCVWTYFNITDRLSEVKYKEVSDHSDTDSVGDSIPRKFESDDECDIKDTEIESLKIDQCTYSLNDDENWDEPSDEPSKENKIFVHPEILPFELSEEQLFQDVD